MYHFVFHFSLTHTGPEYFVCSVVSGHDAGSVHSHSRTCSRNKPRPPVARTRKCVSEEIFAMHCQCPVQCTYTLRQRVPDYVTLIIEARQKLHSLGNKHSSNFLFNELLPLRQSPAVHGGKHIVKFAFAGVPICCELWCQLYGLSATDSRIKKLLAQLRKGCSTWNSNDGEFCVARGVANTFKNSLNSTQRRGQQPWILSHWRRDI